MIVNSFISYNNINSLTWNILCPLQSQDCTTVKLPTLARKVQQMDSIANFSQSHSGTTKSVKYQDYYFKQMSCAFSECVV